MQVKVNPNVPTVEELQGMMKVGNVGFTESQCTSPEFLNDRVIIVTPFSSMNYLKKNLLAMNFTIITDT